MAAAARRIASGSATSHGTSCTCTPAARQRHHTVLLQRAVGCAAVGAPAPGIDQRRPLSGVEVVLNQRLADQGKTFHYLETVEEQLRFFADMPYETQLANLELSLHEAVENPDMFDDLVGAWAEGDMDRLNEIMNSDMREQTPELYEVILVQRNRNWAPEIAAALDGDEDVLIAVGAGHMPGEEGVIALLQNQGLEVRRVQ